MGALKEPAADLYDTDFVAWAEQQAAAIKRGDWGALDVPNLVEEIESMGRQQRAELHDRLVVLLTHLLKLDAQPDEVAHHRSWRLSALEQRKQVVKLLADNPSLKPGVEDATAEAFDVARIVAARESGASLSKLPSTCPWTFDEAMSSPLEAD